MTTPRILLTLIALTVVAACASGGATATKSQACDLTARDSVFASALVPVYRECAVDRPARFVNTGSGHPDFRPPSTRTACYFVDLEFVVDTAGRPEVGTARIVRTNDDGWGRAVLQTLGGWKYEPAVRAAKHVRQIVTSHQTAAVATMVARGNEPPPAGPPPTRIQSC